MFSTGCISGQACAVNNLVSAWDSQRVVTGTPCIGVNINVGVTNAFYGAESVVRGDGLNVLDPLTPPFYTNMISTPSTTYLSIPATSELP